jgi:subtilisin family serine protease
MHNIGQAGGTEDADLDGPEAWDTETGNSSLVIAVLDTGVDLDHEDLAGNLWMNNGEDWVDGSPGNNGVDDDGNGRIDDYYGWDFANSDNHPDDDSDGHGTHVAGIIAAGGNNGVGVTGVAWSASIMPLKMMSGDRGGLVSDEIAAVDYAIEKGAQIINASFGGSTFSQLEYDAIKRARDGGVLFVAGAGNSGTDNDATPVYPASHDLSNIISVAASDQSDHLGGNSNFGVASVDVAAPGVHVYSTTMGNGYEYRTGTSMAAAHVSGLASLIWSEDFALTSAQVKDRILNGVDVKGGLNGLVSTGGRVNAYSANSNGVSPETATSQSGGGEGSGGGGGGSGGGCFIGAAASCFGW